MSKWHRIVVEYQGQGGKEFEQNTEDWVADGIKALLRRPDCRNVHVGQEQVFSHPDEDSYRPDEMALTWIRYGRENPEPHPFEAALQALEAICDMNSPSTSARKTPTTPSSPSGTPPKPSSAPSSTPSTTSGTSTSSKPSPNEKSQAETILEGPPSGYVLMDKFEAEKTAWALDKAACMARHPTSIDSRCPAHGLMALSTDYDQPCTCTCGTQP